jgi:ligand-binding sensor domain-containing protein
MVRLLVLFLIPIMAVAQPFVWTTFTSTSNVVDIEKLNGHLWLASSGGLSNFDPLTSNFDVYTNTRGLAMNQCMAVGKDSRGWVWAALLDGRISRINPQTGEARQIVDLLRDVFEITDFCEYGDEVFAAANNGIYRFSFFDVDSNFHVLESIRKLGGFSGETPVNRVAVAGGYLYAATHEGLARARLDRINLSPPAAWDTFTTANSGLPQNSIVTIAAGLDGSLWIATPTRVLSFDGQEFQNISTLESVIDFADVDGVMYAASATQVYRRENGVWVAFGDSLKQIVRLKVLDTGSMNDLVVAVGDNSEQRGGLVFREGTVWSVPLNAPGIGGNYIEALAVDPKGRLWVGGAANSVGVFVYDNEQWTNYIKTPDRPQGYFVYDIEGFAFDDFGGTWIASQGSGVAWFRGDSMTFFNYGDSEGFDANGPRVFGIGGAPYFVVTRVARSNDGDIYISNRLSFHDLPLIRVPAEWIARGNNLDPWNYYYQGPPSSNDKMNVEELIVDGFNRVWLGNHDDAFLSWVLDDRETPADTSDDNWFSYFPRQYQDDAFTCFDDINGSVLDWEIDHGGYLWVATLNGAYYTQAGIPQDLNNLKFICVADLPFGNRVNDIHVDAQDNKWFATDGGVAVLDRNFIWVQRFRTSSSADYPSDLISNNVTSIASNPQTGEVWIGTPDGLSRLTTPYVSRGADFDELWPYPNPFRADGSVRMFLDHQQLGGKFDELRIYTMSGRLVRKLTWSQMIDNSGGWNGRNEEGDFVAGGVYILAATSNDGKSLTGKIAVLGR